MSPVPVLAIRCRTCDRQVPVMAGEVLLWISPAGPHPSGRAGAYAFVCPECADLAVRSADAAAMDLLRTAGVVPFGAVRHPEGIAAGPAFTEDDLVAFRRLLAAHDCVARLVS